MTSVPLDIKIEIPDYQILPNPSLEPDGKVVTVASGAYALATPSGGGGTTLPDPAGQNGKIVTVVSNAYALANPVAELPSVTGSDNGKVLTVVGGVWASAPPSGGGSGITLGTKIATTSGTSHDFTSLPSGIKRIKIMLNGVSTSGTSSYLIQVGDSGGIENTGYVSGSFRIANGGSASVVSSAAGFILNCASTSIVVSGSIAFDLLDASTNTWVASGSVWDSGLSQHIPISGTKSLSAELDRVRLTTVNGTDTFDAGVFNISYE